MELRDAAERILFATSLEEKLHSPTLVTDERPGVPVDAPAAPGRPSILSFKSRSRGAGDFPNPQRLEGEIERGRLLHFFANHELLAAELMALVLLRFPAAPAAFRQGVWQTLKEEQAHTRLYVRRMQECGIQFGDLPVSGYFWRTIAPMTSPLDFVTGLSLTFEQANLDYCREFARYFTTVGDTATARILDRIYHDEIDHVAHGLKWFRLWKHPEDSDWQAYCRQLKFPLSPQRAKGTCLNAEGRHAAGFDADFIAELHVFSQSKGRTPRVFVFNPFAEGFLAHGRNFTPNKSMASLARDLANIPQFLGCQDDVVLVPQRPRVSFLESLRNAGFALPEFVETRDSVLEPASPLHGRKLGALCPWAWGPDSVRLLEPVFHQVTGTGSNDGRSVAGPSSELYSKAWSVALLQEFLAQHQEPSVTPIRQVVSADFPPLCRLGEVGVSVSSVNEVWDVIAAFRQAGHHRLVVKEALGLAGRNAIRLWEPHLLESQRRWITHVLEQGRRVIVEPWLDRIVDFSVHGEMQTEGLKLLGFTGLINDRRGQYLANWAEPNFARQVPRCVMTALAGAKDQPHRVRQYYAQIFTSLEARLRQAGYRGPIGIDAFVYRDRAGTSRLKPIVEINPRYTMGRLTIELMSRVRPGRCGLFRLVNHRQVAAVGYPNFGSYAQSKRDRFPIILEGEPIPKLSSGFLCLNDSDLVESSLATFQVASSREAITELTISS